MMTPDGIVPEERNDAFQRILCCKQRYITQFSSLRQLAISQCRRLRRSVALSYLWRPRCGSLLSL